MNRKQIIAAAIAAAFGFIGTAAVAASFDPSQPIVIAKEGTEVSGKKADGATHRAIETLDVIAREAGEGARRGRGGDDKTRAGHGVIETIDVLA